MTDFPMSSVLQVIMAIFFPPLAVYSVAGCGFDLIVNIGFLILLYPAAILHALYLLYSEEKRKERVDLDSMRGPYSEEDEESEGGVYGR